MTGWAHHLDKARTEACRTFRENFLQSVYLEDEKGNGKMTLRCILVFVVSIRRGWIQRRKA